MKMKMTRYEETRILGARALQISMGAPLLIKRPKDVYDPIKLAEMEFAEDLIPITIYRHMPEKQGVSEEKASLPVIAVGEEGDEAEEHATEGEEAGEENISDEELELSDDDSSSEGYSESDTE